MSVLGRDERPRSSADALELLVVYGNRGWLKPPPPEEGLTEGMTRQEYGSRRLTGTARPTLDVGDAPEAAASAVALFEVGGASLLSICGTIELKRARAGRSRYYRMVLDRTG